MKILIFLIFFVLSFLLLSLIAKKDNVSLMNAEITDLNNPVNVQNSMQITEQNIDESKIGALGFILPSSFVSKDMTLQKIEFAKPESVIAYEILAKPKADVEEYKDTLGINNPESLWKYSIFQVKGEGSSRQLIDINKNKAGGISVADRFEAQGIDWVYFDGSQPYVVGYRKSDNLFISIVPMFYTDTVSGRKQVTQHVYTLSKGNQQNN